VADVMLLLQRLSPAPDEREALRQRLAAQLDEFEPLFMGVASRIVRADGTPKDMLRDALEALSF